MPKLISNRKWTVMIDAGHGGKDPGAVGKGKTKEKSITLAVSKKIKELSSAYPKLDIRLTRSTDVFLRLSTRG